MDWDSFEGSWQHDVKAWGWKHRWWEPGQDHEHIFCIERLWKDAFADGFVTSLQERKSSSEQTACLPRIKREVRLGAEQDRQREVKIDWKNNRFWC